MDICGLCAFIHFLVKQHVVANEYRVALEVIPIVRCVRNSRLCFREYRYCFVVGDDKNIFESILMLVFLSLNDDASSHVQIFNLFSA